MRGVPFARFVGRAAPLKHAEFVRNVARAKHRFEVEAGCAADRRLEAVVLADRPGSHVAAVAVAVDPKPLRVYIWPFHRFINRGHDVQVVFAAPITGHLLGEFAPVGAGPARVAEEHDESVRREHLLHRHESVTVKPVWAAVDVEHQRVLLGGIEPGRKEQPRFDHIAAAADVEALPLRRRRFREHRRTVLGDLRGLPCFAVEDQQLADRIEARHALRDVAVSGVRAEPGAKRRASFNLFHGARIKVDDIDAAGARADGVEQHVRIVQPDGHGRRLERWEACRGQALQIRGDAAGLLAGQRVDEEIRLRRRLRVAGEDDSRAIG